MNTGQESFATRPAPIRLFFKPKRPTSLQRSLRIVRIGVPHGSFWPAPTFLARRLRGRTASPATCSLVVRREAIRRTDGFEESFRRVYTDQAFYVKLFLESSLLVVDTRWDRYRQHPESACATTDRAGQAHAAYVAYLAWVRRYLTARGVRDRRVLSALRLAEWRARHPRAAAATRWVRRRYAGALRVLDHVVSAARRRPTA